MAPRVLSLSLVFALSALSLSAMADFPSVNARRFTPPTDPAGSLYLEPTPTPGPLAFNAAAWLVYAWRPSVLRDASGDIVANLVSNQLTTDLVGNIGLGQRFALGLDLPVLLYQNGDDNALTRAVSGRPPPAQAFGDLAVTGKGNLISYGALGGFGLSTLLRFSAATGNTASYLSDGTQTAELRLLGEYKIVAVALQATAGFKLRFEETDVLARSYHHEIPWGAALSVRPQAFGWDDKGRWTWVAEIRGAAALPPSEAARDRGQSTAASPVLAGLSARVALGDASVLLGASAGLTQALGNAPLQVMAAVGFAPREHDVDHDGVADEADQCPELAEDRDGFQDGDGCPDWDNDDDNVGDATDRCPAQQEDADGFQDADGCPDPDNDNDSVPDAEDACPDSAGERRAADKKANGCPDKDRDGVKDKADKCPDQPEDRDGFQDADGCPDTDNDQDGVLDGADACPDVARGPVADPKRPGCPSVDRDGDTFDDASDKCPGEAEVFNGVDDDDGCPDDKGKPLVTVAEKGTDAAVSFAQPLRFRGSSEAPEVDASSVPMLRALARELNQRPGYIVAVGIRPKKVGAAGDQAALSQAFAVVDLLRRLTYRDGVAETVGWKAVQKQPGAAKNGFGVLLLPPAAGAPAKPPPALP